MLCTKKQWNAMVALALPQVKRDVDYQQIQHDLLNSFDFLTNSDEHEELTLDVIRHCEDLVYVWGDK